VRRVQLKDRYCVQELDAKFEQYEQSINPDERKKLAEEVQRAFWRTTILSPSSAMPLSMPLGHVSR
jgi:hypothetical protein